MKAVLPSTRIIVLLRDPVSRAYAHYQHAKARYVESRRLEQAVADEIRRNEFPAKRGVALAYDAKPMLGYVSYGYYALQLELLLKLYPRERVHLIDSARLDEDSNAVCNQVFSFLGLEDFNVEPGKMKNSSFNQETIDPQVAEQLGEHYRPYDELLKEIIGQPFQWMRPRTAAA